MSELEKCAEILVDCGYADAFDGGYDKFTGNEYWIVKDNLTKQVPVQIFADTLEGRRQSDSIEDWLRINKEDVWYDLKGSARVDKEISSHQWRLDRIKLCIQKLIK